MWGDSEHTLECRESSPSVRHDCVTLYEVQRFFSFTSCDSHITQPAHGWFPVHTAVQFLHCLTSRLFLSPESFLMACLKVTCSSCRGHKLTVTAGWNSIMRGHPQAEVLLSSKGVERTLRLPSARTKHASVYKPLWNWCRAAEEVQDCAGNSSDANTQPEPQGSVSFAGLFWGCGVEGV